MMDKKTAEVVRAHKIVGRIFKGRTLMTLLMIFIFIPFGATIDYWHGTYVAIPSLISLLISFAYLFSLLTSCLLPYLTIKRMINWYVLDATIHQEMIERLQNLSSIVRHNLLFEGDIKLLRISKDTRMPNNDAFLITYDPKYEIAFENVFSVTLKRYLPIIGSLYLVKDRIDIARIQGVLERITGCDVSKWKKPKKW